MKSKVVFSNGGKTAQFIFANGSESFYFESKEEALFALKQCVQRKKITHEEANSMFEEITLAERLPDHNLDTFILPIIISDFIRSMVEGIDINKKIENPTVNLCDCKRKIKHAYIYDGDGQRVGPPILFKKDGLVFVEHLLKQERITDVDSASLNTLIDLLHIPEYSSLN